MPPRGGGECNEKHNLLIHFNFGIIARIVCVMMMMINNYILGYSKKKKQTKLTIIAEFALIDVILAKWEFLQIGIGFGEQTNHKHSSAERVQSGHRSWRFRYCVPRWIDYDDWQRYGEHPNRLQM